MLGTLAPGKALVPAPPTWNAEASLSLQSVRH